MYFPVMGPWMADDELVCRGCNSLILRVKRDLRAGMVLSADLFEPGPGQFLRDGDEMLCACGLPFCQWGYFIGRKAKACLTDHEWRSVVDYCVCCGWTAEELEGSLSCECGAEKCGQPAHSGWCPKFKP